MIPFDLYFTNINIRPTVKNSLVCKLWYIHIEPRIKIKKVRHYDKKIYDAIINKLYYEKSIYKKYNTIQYFDNIINSIMRKIIGDTHIKNIIKANMIDCHNKFKDIYNDFRDIIAYSEIDGKIAEEYRLLLHNYYFVDLEKTIV